MSRHSFRGATAWIVVAATVVVCVSATGVSRAQNSEFGRTTIATAERTDAGTWEGTWFYVSRLRKMALWIREDGGKPKLKMRLQGAQSGERDGFETDWNGQAAYSASGVNGTWKMDFDRLDADTISGRWTWEVVGKHGGTRETAEFTIYRAELGRQMIWKISNVERENWGGSTEKTRLDELVWAFRKASRREALWAELPF